MNSIEDVKIVMSVLADSVARRLREQGLVCNVVGISVRDSKLCSFTRQKHLIASTDITSEILNTAMELIRESYNFKTPVRSVGITACDLVSKANGMQLSIFDDNIKRIKNERLDKATDSLKARYGDYIVMPALMLKDTAISSFNPKAEHTVHPVGFF